MQTGRPKADLVLSEQARSQLQLFARSRSLLAALCSRARIVLSSAEGEPNNSIAERLRLTKATVGKWRTRFIERRIASLCDDVRPGAPRTIDDERVAQLIKTTLHTKPESGSTHWSVRSVAAETGISKTSVLHPHLQLLAEPGREILCVDHRPRPSDVDRSPAPSNSYSASINSSLITMPTVNPCTGRPPQIRFCRGCIDFAYVLPEQDTRPNISHK